MTPGLSNLQIIPFKVAAYNRKLKMMTFFDENNSDDFDFISGTEMRRLAKAGKQLPDGFMNDKAWSILSDFYRNCTNFDQKVLDQHKKKEYKKTYWIG